MNAIRKYNTKNMTHEEWIERRKEGLGGSDASAICGLSRYRSPLAVYLDKIGELPPLEDNAHMKAGRKLEPLIADWFAEETGMKVIKQNSMFQHPEHEFMLANIDRWILGKNEGLEIKNTSDYNRKDWFDGETEIIPTEYMLQANHYMAVLNAERWWVAVLIGGWDLQWRVIERDDNLIQNLITIEKSFWEENVLKKVPPVVNAQDTELLSYMYPESQPTRMDISESYYDLVKNLLDTKELLEKAKVDHVEAKNKMKSLMGENELAYWQGEKMFSWKSNVKGSRVFKIIGGI